MLKPIINSMPSVLEKRLNLTKNGNGGLHSVLRKTLFTSHMMGLLPLFGLTNPFSYDLRFTLKSIYAVFYVITLIGQISLVILNVMRYIKRDVDLILVSNTLFYLSSCVSTFLLTIIGRSWPKIVREAETIENKLPPFTRNVSTFCNFIAVFLLSSALVEHCMSVLYGVTVGKQCDSSDILQTYFYYNMPYIFDHTPYSLWKAIIGEIFNIQSTFMWSYNDLLIILISIYLSEHFVTHTQLLKECMYQEHFRCEEFRMQYLNVVRLVKMVNETFGVCILLSCGGNMFWICVQLFHILNKTLTVNIVACDGLNKSTLYGIEHPIYFTFSFTFLVVRTLLVLMTAARVHSSAIAPLILLYEVSNSKFNIEIDRYIQQINNIKVALNGLDFFYLTRSTILALLGTIVTYELVLLQFNK